MKTNRIFLVGCPRSGTTLLQSMVASHSHIVSFPETHFFSETLSINPLLRRIKLYGPGSRNFINDFLIEHGYSDIRPFSDLPPLCTHSRWCKALLHTIDEMILAASEDPQSNNIWGLEKTPRHLFYISSIQQEGYQNKFLHILRSGPDVVASLYLATQNYPKQWGGSRSIKKCISWWNNSIKESLKYHDDPNHLFATYEQLLKNPQTVLQSICNYMEIDYQEKMTEDFHNRAEALTKEGEEWKQRNSKQSLSKSNKLKQHFDDETIAYIKKNILSIDLTQFHH
ncbi:sulfotransferase [Fodinibius sp.]|uniref:sulfotransferase family protein n=1 Tax=Fodinibius sp. TaxID=1872440 RepID=UPI002ACEDBFE|nr:sulfotransferase [Fodinibius sp.]MDZ7659813.1 sulfotransferase [Fodinibius sp.]